ncbi:MAG: phosphoribosylamine--glycine ligase [Burkholderia sp.]|nr:phosphoribosylamine--glycine ligase [Burkholderia sp.]
MKLLVVGSGGREHAFAWKLAQSPHVTKVYVAPGNGGIAQDTRLQNVEITEFDELINFVESKDITFTLVGPEAPLADGIVNIFRARGLKIFGPTREAMQLESSKNFAKIFMKRHGIPTADYESFTDAEAAHAYINSNISPIVVKADGLKSGKGVIVAKTPEEAHEAIDMMMLSNNKLDGSSDRILIEQFVDGEEVSFIVMADGKNVLTLASSKDYKRLLDNDQGKNTGGMGAYSPVPIVTPQIHARIMREIIMPTIRGMEKDRIRFTGFLYAGLMITKDSSLRVLEFNCRMGDPETQSIMPRMKSDFSKIIEHAIAGTLDKVDIDWDRRTALGVVLAAHGYPESPRKGDRINGIQIETTQVITFHSGTKLDGDKLVTSGGRILCVVGLADSISEAQQYAYDAINQVNFDGMQYRRDIGYTRAKS